MRFFAYVVDDGQARLTTTEADHARWIRPADALDEFAEGGLRMLPPTESVLRQLVGYERAADALAALAATVVRPLLPRRRPDGSAWDLVDAYTGEVLREGVDRPHTRETDGRPAETST